MEEAQTAVKACLWVLCPVASLDACLSAAVVVSLDPAAVLAVSLGAWGLLHHSKACLVVFHLDPVQKAWSLAVVYGHRPHQTTGPNGNVVGGICWRRTCRHKAAVGSSLYFTVPQHNFQVLGTAASCSGSGQQYVASRRHGSSRSAIVLVEVSRTALQSAAGLRLVFSGRGLVVLVLEGAQVLALSEALVVTLAAAQVLAASFVVRSDP